MHKKYKFKIYLSEDTVNHFGMEQNRSGLEANSLYKGKIKINLPSHFHSTVNSHDPKLVPLQLGHLFFINKIDQGQNRKNMKPLLGGVTVLLQLLQCIVAMLFHLLSLEVQKMFSNKHFVTM